MGSNPTPSAVLYAVVRWRLTPDHSRGGRAARALRIVRSGVIVLRRHLCTLSAVVVVVVGLDVFDADDGFASLDAKVEEAVGGRASRSSGRPQVSGR